MLTRQLLHLARLVDSRPKLLMSAVLIPGLLLGVMALRAPIDLTFAGVLDRSQPEVARYLEKSESLGFGGTLIVVVRADPSLEPAARDVALSAAAQKLDAALGDHPAVAGVIVPLARDWFVEQLFWLAPEDEFDSLVGSLRELLSLGPAAANGEGPSQIESRMAVLEALLEEAAGPIQDHGDRVIQVRLRSDPLVQSFGGNSYFELEPLIATALAGSDVEYDLSGFPAVAAQDQGKTLDTVRRLSPLSLLAVLLLVFAVERRWRVLLAILVALLLAVAATLGVIGLLAGGLTLMETFFGVTVFGLGIDFAIHLLLRLKEERASGLSLSEALERALGGTGRGVIAGAVTTAGAFLIVATAPDPVAVHLGLSGGIGLTFCLVLMLVLVPVAWRRVEGGRVEGESRSDGAPPSSSTRPQLGLVVIPQRIAEHAVKRPWVHLGLALALLFGALLGVPRFALESRMEKVFNRDVPAVRTVNEVRERFGVSGAPWVIAVESLEEAAEVAVLLRSEEAIATVASPSDLLSIDPLEAERRQRVLAELHPALHQALAPLSAGIGFLGADDRLTQLLSVAQALDRGIEQGPPTEATLPLGLRLQFRGTKADDALSSSAAATDAPWLVYAYAKESTFDAHRVREARLAVQAVAPEATSVSVLLEAVLLGPRPWVWKVGLGVMAFVILVLLVDLRSGRWMVLALLPVMVASTVTFGVLCWLPLNFNVMTVMVVPLLVGLGVDDGIHVVHRMREAREPLAVATGAVGRAILMTTATTCASFTILLFTNHPGLETMALVMLIGLPLCLLASISTLPAAASLLRP